MLPKIRIVDVVFRGLGHNDIIFVEVRIEESSGLEGTGPITREAQTTCTLYWTNNLRFLAPNWF